jgi:hypothetical protein
MKRHRGNSAQTLIVGNLTGSDLPSQVQSAIHKVSQKYIEPDMDCNIKIVQQENPIIFNVVVPHAGEYFQYSIQVPDGMDVDAQALLKSIPQFTSHDDAMQEPPDRLTNRLSAQPHA